MRKTILQRATLYSHKTSPIESDTIQKLWASGSHVNRLQLRRSFAEEGLRKIPKLKQAAKAANIAPKPLTPPPQPGTISGSSSSSNGYAKRLYIWFRRNLPVIGLNFGSACILLGFSRSGTKDRMILCQHQIVFLNLS